MSGKQPENVLLNSLQTSGQLVGLLLVGHCVDTLLNKTSSWGQQWAVLSSFFHPPPSRVHVDG